MNRSRYVVAAALLAGTAPVTAQKALDGYLFKQPHVSLSFRIGQTIPQASSDIYDFFTKELTLNKDDFRATAFAADLGLRVTSRLDLVIGLAGSKSTNRSEFREWVDQDDQPIEQVTTLTRTPISVSAKYHLRSRGEKLGELAWVPNGLQPYVGAGAGVMYYTLKQEGDFVDHETLDVFSDYFTSSGNAPMAQVLAGAEWWVLPRIGVTAEGRYAWSRPTLKNDFQEWDNIDLRGFQLATGLALRF